MFPNRFAMDRDTPSPEPLVYLRVFIHSCLLKSPKRALLHIGENIRSSSPEPHGEGRPTYNGVRSGFPKGYDRRNWAGAGGDNAPLKFFVPKNSIIVIQINHQPDATFFSLYYPDIYFQLNMFRAFSRLSSGAR
jgi:hypothetical protein